MSRTQILFPQQMLRARANRETFVAATLCPRLPPPLGLQRSRDIQLRKLLHCYFAGDIAPDIDLLSNLGGNSMYDDPTEYQRTKRSYIQDDDTGLTNDDDNDNDEGDDDDDIGDEGFYDGDEDDDDRTDSQGKGLKASDSSSSVLHKKDEIHQVNAKHVEQKQPLSMEDDDKSPDEVGSSDDSEGSSSGSGSAEITSQNSYAR